MCSQVIAWLSRRVQEFGDLPENEKKAIQDFSMLWSFFECRKLKCRANMTTIKNYVQSIRLDGSLGRLNIDGYLQYLRDRYFTNGQISQHYDGLHLEKSGQEAKNAADRMLQGNNISKANLLIGCLAIVYRLRNNLFHGEKWRYQLQGQYDNFTMANNFLMSLFPSEINCA